MKIVQINTFSNGSTGSIMMNIHNELQKNGVDSYVVWGRGRKSNNNHEIYMNDKIGVYFHALYSRITGNVGFASKHSTKILIKKLNKINPDIVHLHNIHGYYINIEMLFKYLKEKDIKVIWTLHDCWAFTGHCSHFITVNCQKWKNVCFDCPLLKNYPKSFVDNSTWNFEKKKELFNGLNLTIITPSKWLADLVKESFLKNYKIEVINNGVDTSVFKPIKGNFRLKNHLENKKIILGVANVWTKQKGIEDFIELSKVLDPKYVIVLIGLTKKQIKKLPSNILGIKKTKTSRELAEIYSSADVLFNPTYEDNYPTVNLESIACNTPVITYDTGGSKECLNEFNGKVTTLNDMKLNYSKIINKNFIFNNDYSDKKLMIKNYF